MNITDKNEITTVGGSGAIDVRIGQNLLSALQVMGRVFVAKKILLVDDSSTTRVMYRVLISRNTGYEVESARDGNEGLRMALVSRPDLILMDIMMPGLSGLHVCRALKEDDRTKSIPIVLLTGKTGPASVQSGFEFGCDEYLTKPVDEAVLLNVLEKYLV